MPKRDEAFMQQQRERILDAAYRCFLRKGFRDTSIRDICKEADLSIGAIYNHFDNREAIIRAVSEQITAQTTGGTPEDCSVDEFIRDITNIVIECHKNPSMTELNHQLVADAFSTDHMAEVYSDLMRYSADWMKTHLKRFHKNGEIELPADMNTTVQGISSFLTGFSLRMYFDNARSERVIAKQMHTLIAHLIGAPKVTAASTVSKRKAS